MDSYHFQSLFSQVSLIEQQYEEVADTLGENFNIFRLLKIETDEVRLHSAFLAELMNPKGSHGQGASFFEALLKLLKIDFDITNYHVKIELSTGNISKDFLSGGRIDILVQNHLGHCIIIENKIYADDEKYQLVRYRNYGAKFPRHLLLYLNLFGSPPGQLSTGGILTEDDYKVISYHDHIISWLTTCLKESTQQPILRESITQYIHTIKSLTNQNTNSKMNQAIIKTILKSKENTSAAFTIANSLEAVKEKLMENFSQKLIEARTKFGNVEIKSDPNLGKMHTDIRFTPAHWEKHYISVYFNGNNYDEVIIGVFPKEGAPQAELRAQTYQKLDELMIGHSLNWSNWTWLNRFKGFPDLRNDQEAWDYLFTDSIPQIIIPTINAILEKTEEENIAL